MHINIEVLKHELQAKGIRPSYQRLKVLEYLKQKDTHPTVDELFNLLASDYPTLSKATVYNTVHTFITHGLVRTVGIDENFMRYDGMISDHGHFKCEKCGKIINFPIEINPHLIEELSQFEINEKDVFFKGLCPDCKTQ